VAVYEFVTFAADARAGDARRRWAVPALALAAALLVGGCGPGSSSSDAPAGHGGGGHDEVPVSLLPSQPSKPMSVLQLAKGMGCKAQPSGKFADYRLASCEYHGKKLVLTDFDTDEGQSVFLHESKPYGGVYLVGDRWMVTGNTLAEISPLQDMFGGKIEQGDIHGPPPATDAK
jgi:hypothetical protein